PWAIWGLRESHLFLGNDDFYVFNGGAPTPIGTSIRDEVFRTINPNSLEQNFSIGLSDSQEFLTFICGGGNNAPNRVWVLNYAKNIWYQWSCSGPTCAALHRLENTVMIDDLVGTIDAQTWAIDDPQLAAAYPQLLTGNIDGKVYRWGKQYSTDAGQPIVAYWTSKDWIADDVTQGFARHFVHLRSVGVASIDSGPAVTLKMSTSVDGGEHWAPDEILMVGGTGSGAVVDTTWFKEVTDKRIRVRIMNDTLNDLVQITGLYFNIEVDSQTF
ncbi:MAG TPA: hypothetical protein VNS88_04875, partial [Nitrospiraceae bacterium]|nr:hypothetical protein [Nitrospiraceae bacterium]